MDTHDGGQHDIEITLIEANDPLTKTYEIGEDKAPAAIGSPFLTRGTAKRVLIPTVDFASEFAQLLACLHPNSCIVLGALSDQVSGDVADLTTKTRHRPRNAGEGSPLIWRGKEWMGYRSEKPGILGLDHDAKDLPRDLRERLQSHGGLLSVLMSICPDLAKSARVWRPSVSTGIEVVETGATSMGGGSHTYVPILDGGDAEDFVNGLSNRLILAGWGYAFVSASGSVQVRSLIDVAASGVGGCR